MTELEKFGVLANQLQAEDPQQPVPPIPHYARNHNGGDYVCSPDCGKLFAAIASKNRH